MARIEVIKYRGLTKRQYKKLYGSSTPGMTKAENCQATGLDKAMAKYPRAWKTNPTLYVTFNKKKDKAAKRQKTFFTNL